MGSPREDPGEESTPGSRPGPAPAGTPAPGPRLRRPKFALPDDDHDPRVVEAISSLLDGPPEAPPVAPGSAPAWGGDRRRGARRGDLPRLDSRADWYATLRHEAARHDRYGRPVAVAAIEVVPVTADGMPPARVLLDGLLGQVGSLLRGNARAVDRVARVGTLRFNVLLPETGWDQARAFAERLSGLASRDVARGTLRARLRIAIGVPGTGESLEETLALTEAALAR